MTNYTLDNQTPSQIVRPATAEELAEVLRAASAAGHAVVPWGGGTRQHIGGPPARYDIALDTTRLARIVEYTPADLVIIVEAGATLAAVQAALAPNGQWLPWNPPLPEQAGIGGLLASGASGPLRLGYGTPREWTLGMRVALGDGRLVKSGSKVVKNVAGYDAHKLHLGALGTLGVIVEATFKVAPLPRQRRTLLASFTSPRALLTALDQLAAAPLQPISLVALNDVAERSVTALHAFLDSQPTHILAAARFAGTAGAVNRQLREAVQRCVEVGARTIELSEDDDSALWNAIATMQAPGMADTLLLRVGVPAGAFVDMARLLEQIPEAYGWLSARMVLAGVGLGYCRWQLGGATSDVVAAAVAELRGELVGKGGYVVVEEAPARLGAALDRWGPPPAALPYMRALRRKWDPQGILNPGRYLV